jgi:hypothetical protein
MKWFKHMSAAHSDDKIVFLRSKFGMWGVGAYWSLIERVAQEMKGKNPAPAAKMITHELCVFLGCKPNKLSSFLECLQNLQGMYYKQSGVVLEINIPKLLSIRDNYNQDLEVSTKKLPSKEVEVEVEVEVKKEKTTSLRVASKISKKEPDHLMRHVVKHIYDRFEQKRAAKYPFTGKHAKIVERLCKIYRHEEIMALWDLFLISTDEFYTRCGYSIECFAQSLPKLLDSSYKSISKKYEKILYPDIITEGAALQRIGLIGKEMPK